MNEHETRNFEHEMSYLEFRVQIKSDERCALNDRRMRYHMMHATVNSRSAFVRMKEH